MNKEMYNIKIYRVFMYLTMIIPLLIFNGILSIDFIKELDGINFALATIAIPCTFLFYYIKGQKNLYLYICIYISILCEHFIYLFLTNHNIETSNNLVMPFMFRISLILIILNPKDKILTFISNHKKSFIFTSIFINIFFITLSKFINLNLKNNIPFMLFYFIFILFSFYIVTKLLLRSYNENDFIQSIYLFSFFMLRFRLIFNILRYTQNTHTNLLIILEKVFFTLSFSILLIGLFVELIFIHNENAKLNQSVKIIKNNIEELKEMEKLRSHFFANISHEFKTPLNIIFSCIQLLDINDTENFYNLGEKYSKYEPTIKQNCYRMIRLINNLVDITKIDSGFMNINFHNYDIVNLVENITQSIVPYVKSKNLNIIFDTYVEELIIKCDSDSIERIMLNVLSNSIKFSNDTGNILVVIDSDERFVTIRVIDDGIGIPYEKRDSIFDIFIQGDKSLTRKNEGSGIGLSLVKSLVSIHGGTVSIGKNIDIGTEIIIKLPNIKLNEDDYSSNIINNYNDSLISKINIEFSDIYDLY